MRTTLMLRQPDGSKKHPPPPHDLAIPHPPSSSPPRSSSTADNNDPITRAPRKASSTTQQQQPTLQSLGTPYPPNFHFFSRATNELPPAAAARNAPAGPPAKDADIRLSNTRERSDAGMRKRAIGESRALTSHPGFRSWPRV